MPTVVYHEKNLEEVAFSTPQARAIADVVQDSRQETVKELRAWMAARFFSKEDGARMEGRLELKISGVEMRLTEKITQVRDAAEREIRDRSAA